MKERMLYGTGIRYKVFDQKIFSGYLGIGVMQEDEKYNRIMEQFGSIEAYQEAKSHKKPPTVEKPKKQEPEGYKGGGSVRIARRGGGRAYGKNS